MKKFAQRTFAFVARSVWVAASLSLAVGAPSTADAAGSGITYHGRIIKPDGNPLEGKNVSFKMQIRSAGNEDCLLYEEVKTVDMRNSVGVVALTLNDGTGQRGNDEISSGVRLSLDKVFANRGMYPSLPDCATGFSWTPNAADGRKLAIFMRTSSDGVWEALPSQMLNFVPMAIEAKQVGGFTAQHLLRVDDSAVAQNTTPLALSDLNELKALIAGSSTQYERAGRLGGIAIPTGFVANESIRWNGTTWEKYTSLAASDVQTFAKTVLPTCTAGQILTSDGTALACVNDGAGAIGDATTTVKGVVAVDATGGISVSGGTISLSASGASAGTFTKVTVDTFGRVTAGATLAAGDVPALDASKVTTGTFGASQIPSLDASKVTTGTFATPGMVSGSAITSGTIGGSTAIVTSGAVSSSSLSSKSIYVWDSDNTNSVQIVAPATASLTGDYVLTLPTTDGASGEVLQTDGSGNLSWVSASAGSVTNVGLSLPSIFSVTGGPVTSSGTFSATLASQAANTVFAAPDGSSGAPTFRALAAGDIPSLDASKITTGTISSAQLPASALLWSTDGTNVFRTSGNVGIGTTATGSDELAVTKDHDGNTNFSIWNPNTGTSAYTSVFVTSSNDVTASLVAGSNARSGTTDGFASAGHVALSASGANASALGIRTATAIPLYLATNGTARMFIEATGGIGIGTTSPSASLDIVGGETFSTGNNGFRMGDTSGGYIRMSDGTSSGSQFVPLMELHPMGATRGAVIQSMVNVAQDTGNVPALVLNAERGDATALTTRPVLDVRNGSVSKMLLDANGQLGIGTTSPQALLDVNGAIRLGSTATCTSATNAGTLRFSAGVLQFCAAAGDTWTTLSSSTGDNLGNHTATANVQLGNYWLSGDGGSEGVFVASDGKVGVGTSSPNYSFEVNGTSTASTQMALGAGAGDAGSARLINTNGGGTSSVTFEGAGGNVKSMLRSGYSSGSTDAYLSFHTRGSNAVSERMRIDSAGNVGIGTTAPTYPLDVTGTIRSTSGGIFQGNVYSGNGSASAPSFSFVNSNTSGVYLPSTNVVGLSTNGSERLRVDSSGNVGIGVTAPNHTLDLLGRASLSQLSGGIATPLYLSGTHTALTQDFGVGIDFRQNGIPTGMMAVAWSANASNANTYMAFSTKGTGTVSERLRITATGAVGIGTSAPASMLDVAGGVRIGDMTTCTSASNAGTLRFNGGALQICAAAGDTWTTLSTSTGDNLGNHTATANIQLSNFWLSGDGGNEGIFVASNGGVGIGTTNPGASLDVAGVIQSTNAIKSGSGSPGAPGHSFTGDTDTGLFRAAADTVGIATNGTERLRIESTGRIGIGNTAPQAELDVTGTSRAWTFSAGWGSVAGPSYGAGGGGMYGPNGSDIGFTTNSQERIRVTGAGNVGIGTTAPTGILDVNGGTSASGNGTNITLTAQSAAAGSYSGGHILLFPGAKTGSGQPGSVGIGATAPGWMAANSLLVSGNIYSNTGIGTSGSVTGSSFLQGPYLYGGSIASSNLTIDSTSDSTKGIISIAPGTTGYVGVGTTNPTTKLYVRDDGNGAANGSVFVKNNTTGTNARAAVSLESDNSGAGATLMQTSTTYSNGSFPYWGANQTILHGASPGGMRFVVNNNSGGADISYFTHDGTSVAERMRLRRDGNLGIGTTAPTASLTVNGASVNLPSSVSLTADNQVVDPANRGYIQLSSDAAATSRTFCLAAGATGQQLILELTSANGAELTHGAQPCGGASVATALGSTFTFTSDDTLVLLYNGTKWVKLSSSAN